MGRKKQSKKFGVTKYLPVLIILLSITIMVGSTFAYFTDKKEEVSELTFSKVELSSETTIGIDGELRDVIPGTKLVDGEVAFSKSIDSEAIYVRAKVSFSLPKEYENDADMNVLLDALRSATDFNIVSSVQYGAVWSVKQGNYFYLLDNGNTSNLMRVDTIDKFVLSSEIVVPRDLKQLNNNAQYMKSINFHVAFEAVQADNVSNVLTETIEVFNELFPVAENEKVYTLTFNNDNAGEVVFAGAGKVIESFEVEKPGYKFGGWYTQDGSQSGDWGDKVVFPLVVNGDLSLFAKWEQIEILAVKQTGVGNGSTLSKVGLNATYNLTKGTGDKEGIFINDDYMTEAVVYKDIEIRALEYGTNNVLAVLDKDNDTTNNTADNKIVTATQFPWDGNYDGKKVDIYTYYPSHYFGYVPDGNGNFYFILSDVEITGDIEIEEDVIITTNEMNMKFIEGYYLATFETSFELSDGTFLSLYDDESVVSNFRSVAQQFVYAKATLGCYNEVTAVMNNSDIKYTVQDYRKFDYDILYLIKYANFDSSNTVGYGITNTTIDGSDVVATQITDISTYTSATAQGYGVSPTIANCQAVAGYDGYVGVNGLTPVWCLGISNAWAHGFKMLNGVAQGSKNIYYTEDVDKYSTDADVILETYTHYNATIRNSSAFNSVVDIYGTEDGQVDNPLFAYFINKPNKLPDGTQFDQVALKTSAGVSMFHYGGYFNMAAKYTGLLASGNYTFGNNYDFKVTRLIALV